MMANFSKLVVPVILILLATALAEAASVLPITNVTSPSASHSSLSNSIAFPSENATTTAHFSPLCSNANATSHPTSAYHKKPTSLSADEEGCIFVSASNGNVIEVLVPAAELEELGTDRHFVAAPIDFNTGPAAGYKTKPQSLLFPKTRPTWMPRPTLNSTRTWGAYGVGSDSYGVPAPSPTFSTEVDSTGTPVPFPIGPVSTNISPALMLSASSPHPLTAEFPTLTTSTVAKATPTGTAHLQELNNGIYHD